MSATAEEREQARRALERAAAAGIRRIALPTPFQVGRVNVYLIDDDPLTLVDVGPNSGTALEDLEEAFAADRRTLEEVGLIVITHQHMDHFGLAAILARRSGAEVAALDVLAPYLADFDAEAEREDEYAAATMLRHGVPADYATALRTVSAGYHSWGEPVQVSMPLADGAELRLRDRTLQVLRRPGHSPSDTVFLDAERRLLIAGDHLIKTISSNALVTLPLAADPAETSPRQHLDGAPPPPRHLDGRAAPLLTYVDSLRRTRAMDVELVLPGHGPLFGDHAGLIAERLRMHTRRAEKIAGLLAQRPLTAHEIALELWGDVAVTQAYLTLSEVLGHVDLLLEQGRVREELDGEVVRFATAG